MSYESTEATQPSYMYEDRFQVRVVGNTLSIYVFRISAHISVVTTNKRGGGGGGGFTGHGWIVCLVQKLATMVISKVSLVGLSKISYDVSSPTDD